MPFVHEPDVDHERFLINEGLDALAAYRAIRSEDLRSIARRLMAGIAEAERDGPIGEALDQLAILSNAILDLKTSRKRV